MQPQWINQVQGMVKYEFRIQWRQRGLKVIVLALLVLQVLMALTVPARSDAGNFVKTIWITTAVVLVMLMPIVVAEAIPRDRQVGMHELLDALPLRTNSYLLGKLCGTWISVAAGIGVVWIITGVLARLAVGPFDLGEFLWLATAGVWTLTVLNCGMTVLAAADQPGAMRAMLVGFFCVVMFPIAILVLNSTPTLTASTTIWDMLSPLRMPLYDIPRQSRQLVLLGTTLSRTETVLLTVAAGLVELAVLWWLAVYWLRTAEARH